MRRPWTNAAAVVLAVPLLNVLPTATMPGRSPHPVTPSVWSLPLQGVDRASVAELDGARPLLSRGSVAPASPTILTPPRTTKVFQTLGVTWSSASTSVGVRVQVRWRPAKGQPGAGAWSAWTPVDTDPDLPQEAGVPVGAVRGGTDPLWTGPADGVQVRLDADGGLAPRDLRLELIDPGASSYDAHVGETPPGSAAAAAAIPGINRRAAWGADESRKRGTVEYMPTIRAGVLHHTAGVNGYSASQVPSILRGDYAYHLSRGWNDIGYNFLVDRFGRIWEGRAGGMDRAVRGAHSAGFNQDTVGVSVIGNYETAKPSSAVVDAIARIFAWKLDVAARDPQGRVRLTSDSGDGTSRFERGRVVTVPVIMGHREVGWTACPGRYLYPLLDRIRARAAQFMGVALVDRTISKTTVYQGNPISIGATAISATTWSWSAQKRCTGTAAGTIVGTTKGRWRIAPVWSGRPGGVPARAGVYRFTLAGRRGTSVARPWQADVTVLPPPSTAMPAGSAVVAAGGVTPLPSTRLVDTRAGALPAMGPGNRLDFVVAGRGGVPADAAAVVLSVTSLCPSQAGALTIAPTGSGQPWQPVFRTSAWTTGAAPVVVPLSNTGKVSLLNSAGITDVVVDVVGYVSAASTARTVVAAAPDLVGSANVTIPARGGIAPDVPAVGGVAPADMTAAWVDVRVNSTAPGWLILGRAPASTAVAQALNHPAGASHLLFLAPVTGGKVQIRNQGTAAISVTPRVVAVQTASGAGTRLTAIAAPWRLATAAAVTSDGTTLDATVTSGPVPAGARAVLATVTASSSGRSALTVAPAGAAAPLVSSLDIASAGSASALVMLPLDGDGRTVLRTVRAAASVTVDVVAYVG